MTAPGSAAADIQISVVIPSYHSRETILECLESISEQIGSRSVEIIVVDSSSDRTPELIEREFPTVRLIRLPHRAHAGVARNIGACHAKGQVLAFTDADCIAKPDWIDNLYRVHLSKSENECIIAGAIENGTPTSAVGCAEWLIQFSNSSSGLPRRDVGFAATANLSMPRRLFLETRGFDDSKTGQDMVFGETLRNHGHAIQSDPGTRVSHLNRTAIGPFLRRQFILGMGSALVRRRVRLKGHWVVRIPPLVPFLIPYRFFQIARRMCRSNPRNLALLAKTSHLVLTGLVVWVGGFLTGAMKSPAAQDAKRGIRLTGAACPETVLEPRTR